MPTTQLGSRSMVHNKMINMTKIFISTEVNFTHVYDVDREQLCSSFTYTKGTQSTIFMRLRL